VVETLGIEAIVSYWHSMWVIIFLTYAAVFLKKRDSLILLFIGALLLYVYLSPYSWLYYDVGFYMLPWLEGMENGQMLYRDLTCNYPPLFPFLLYSFYEIAPVDQINWLRIFLRFPLIIFFLLIGFLLYKTTRDKRASRRWLLNWWSITVICTLYQFDVIPTFFVLLSLYLLERGKAMLSGLSLAIGTMFKFYPIILLPLMLIYTRKKGKFLIPFLIACLLIALPFIFLCFESLYENVLGFHGNRFPQELSIYHTVLLGNHYTYFPSQLTWIWLFPFVSVYPFLIKYFSKTKGLSLYEGAVLILLLFLLLSKVSNPNFALWIFPMLFILKKRSYVTMMEVPIFAWNILNWLPFVTLRKPIFIVQDLRYYDSYWLTLKGAEGFFQRDILNIVNFFSQFHSLWLWIFSHWSVIMIGVIFSYALILIYIFIKILRGSRGKATWLRLPSVEAR